MECICGRRRVSSRHVAHDAITLERIVALFEYYINHFPFVGMTIHRSMTVNISYVTWEIAPGKLADGSIVDVWSKSNEVSWEMPGAGAPCTSTARAGRWRSFPYLAGLDGEDGETLWSYLCRQWDEENNVNDTSGVNGGRKLLRFNFFMLQADVLPNMGFSATRKRLIHSHDCLSGSNFAKEEERGNAGNGEFNFAVGSGEL